MNAHNGSALAGTAHLAQSVGRILTTPLGSLPMRRDFGSMLFELIDAPANRATAMLLRAATAIALRKWELRLTLTRVILSADAIAQGEMVIGIEGRPTDQAAPNALVSLSIPIRRPVAASS